MTEPDDYIKNRMKHTVMVGDRHFSGQGEYNERGHSIVFIPKKDGFIFGSYGVHASTFKALRRRLKAAAREHNLK